MKVRLGAKPWSFAAKKANSPSANRKYSPSTAVSSNQKQRFILPSLRSITHILELIADEVRAERQGAAVVLKSLAEVLMVHALREHIESEGESPAWLYALRDDKVARVLSMIHEAPASKHSVADMAAHVGLSRSELFARFSALVGEPPAKYSTRWRMHLATQALIREQANLAEVAERIGYSTEAAFSKAFKRFMGGAPGAYRERHPAPQS
ncbi:MAG: AraC family transcriptional regulator [Myxococcales bacterium]|nr:AraC family transcriptional regulator [Myxococcales bacterium]